MIKIDEEVKEILRKVNEVAEEEIIKVGDTIKFKDANYYKSLGYTQDKHKYFFDNANAEKPKTSLFFIIHSSFVSQSFSHTQKYTYMAE